LLWLLTLSTLLLLLLLLLLQLLVLLLGLHVSRFERILGRLLDMRERVFPDNFCFPSWRGSPRIRLVSAEVHEVEASVPYIGRHDPPSYPIAR
jgi:hypothetical protein